MKLKTLKDLKGDEFICTLCLGKGMPILKQEAIKWVKSLRFTDGFNNGNWETSNWIIDFFNITEED